jgi:putative ABC transport system substrate-binding protein
VLWNADNPSIVLEMEQLQAAARALGLDLTAFSAKPNDIEVSFAAIANGGFDGLVVTTDAYSADFFKLWRLGASYVDRILKGEKPSNLPIEQPTAVTLKINLKTAKALDLALPSTLVARADEVIE